MSNRLNREESIVISKWFVANRVEIHDLKTHDGEFLHLLGPNGSGKSSLLESIAGLLFQDSGEIKIFNRQLIDWPLSELAHQRAYLGQHLSCQFELSVADVIGFFAAHSHIPESVEQALEVNSLMSLPLNQLSGGQQQRVHIARALLQVWPAVQQGRAIIVLDEPLQHLDITHQQSCLVLLQKIAAMGNTVVMSSHDINLSNQFATSIALLKSGKILFQGSPQQVMNVTKLNLVFECDFHLVYSENEYEFFHPRVNS